MNLKITRVCESLFAVGTRRANDKIAMQSRSEHLPRVGFVVGMSSNVDLNIRDDLLAQATLILFQVAQLFGHEDLLLTRRIDGSNG